MKYELSLRSYKGPLETLLELVLEKKLEISTLSLAEVTGDFLVYVAKLEKEHVDHSLIADFLVIASKLILIKSKVLLPSLSFDTEEEEDVQDLERRLKIYLELKKTNILIRKEWSELPTMMGREIFMNLKPVFYPPRVITEETLQNVFMSLMKVFEKTLLPVEKIKTEIIHLKTKIEEVLARITKTPFSLQRVYGARPRRELVVLFLAILHLIKDQLVHVHQEDNFRDITIAKKT